MSSTIKKKKKESSCLTTNTGVILCKDRMAFSCFSQREDLSLTGVSTSENTLSTTETLLVEQYSEYSLHLGYLMVKGIFILYHMYFADSR